jgi:hypothetical protein
MASICGAFVDTTFVERVANIIPPGFKDAWTLAERTASLNQGVNVVDEQVTIPGVSYGEVGSGEETLKYTFTLHCASLFRKIRARYDIKDEDFKSSICTHRAIKGGLVEPVGGAGGDAGSMFFFSKDHKFSFKLIKAKEADTLR